MEEIEKKAEYAIDTPSHDSSDLKAILSNYLTNYSLDYYFKAPNYSYPIKKNEKNDQKKNRTNEKPIDVVIIVAVPSEYDGVYYAFNLTKSTPRSTDLMDKYRFGYVRFEQNGLQIALLIQPGMGMTHSASLCTRAVLAFNPKLVAMVGICAGRPDKVHLGDVVIASSVFDYTAGKQYVDRFGPRPQVQQIDTVISEFISTSVLGNHELLGRIIDCYNGEKPRNIQIHFKPLASGTAVIDDAKVVNEIVNIQDDLAAIDMEAYALATAANILRTKWIVIKSVQDFADGNKSETESSVRAFATYSSAKLLQLILNDLHPYIG